MERVLWYVLVAALLTIPANTQTSNEPPEQKLVDIMCELNLGDIPSCPASSCKEVADTKLRSARSGYYWLVKNAAKF